MENWPVLSAVWDYIFTWSDDTPGRFHLGFALTALATGPVIFLNKKGTLLHRVCGYVFILSMLAVNGTALTKYQFSGGFNFFHFAALMSLATLLPAIYYLFSALRLGRRNHLLFHGIFMVWTYFGLVMAAIAETVTRGFPYLLHGEGGWARFLVTLSIFMTVTGYFTYRLTQKKLPGIVGLRNPKKT